MLTHHSSRPEAPPRVVLLGARGFIAGRLAERLRAAAVDVLSLASTDVDLTAPASVGTLQRTFRPDDAVVFLSAITPDKGKDIRTSMRNLGMGEHVCEALAASSVTHVIYISSDAVYDDDASPMSEASRRGASTLYGLMHVVRERMLLHTLDGTPTRLAILRPVALYGAGDTHNGYGPNRFLRSALERRQIDLFGGGEEKRDHLLVDDFVGVIDLALRHRSEGMVNVATGCAVSFAEVAETVRALVGGDVSSRRRPASRR
jgi:nucleoside-diphosphate-sugar epimerase